eukprot:11212930-Lingulodinium_polyedra.AAC.1
MSPANVWKRNSGSKPVANARRAAGAKRKTPYFGPLDHGAVGRRLREQRQERARWHAEARGPDERVLRRRGAP